ncbi:Serine/threonine-protein kinase rio1, partial [Coemansia sp. RSA 1933]
MATDIRQTAVDLADDEHNEEYSYSDSYSDDDANIETDDILGYTEDWGENGADFTKQYNRMRQHVQSQANGGAPTSSLASNKGVVGNSNGPAAVKDNTSLKTIDLNKYSSRIKLDEFDSIADINVGGSSGVGGGRKSSGVSTAPRKDKADRATTEQVLDPRTRIILFKLLNQGVIYEVNGCISTGKEANVYHAVTENGEHRAIKIYKTSILVFKDRDRYVSGEYRFRHGYSRHNPRKMVRL